MSIADVHALSGVYAVDALTDSERAEFEAHLRACADCRREVASFTDAASYLSLLHETAPPVGLREQVLDLIRTEGTSGPRSDSTVPAESRSATIDIARERIRRRPVRRWLAVAAAAVVLASAGGLAISRPWEDDGGGQVTATQQVVRAGDAQRFEQQVGSARATLVRSPSLGRAVLITQAMPSPPQGKTYQLWLSMPGKGMVNAGLMPGDEEGNTTVMLEGDATRATGAGITVEPQGGSATPTGKPVVLFTFT